MEKKKLTKPYYEGNQRLVIDRRSTKNQAQEHVCTRRGWMVQMVHLSVAVAVVAVWLACFLPWETRKSGVRS